MKENRPGSVNRPNSKLSALPATLENENKGIWCGNKWYSASPGGKQIFFAGQQNAGPSRQDDRQVESLGDDRAYGAYSVAQPRAAGFIPVLFVERAELQDVREESLGRVGSALMQRPQNFLIPQQGQPATNNSPGYYQTSPGGSGLNQRQFQQQAWDNQQSQSPTSQQSEWYQAAPQDASDNNRRNQE
jgi:hypothetical protein